MPNSKGKNQYEWQVCRISFREGAVREDLTYEIVAVHAGLGGVVSGGVLVEVLGAWGIHLGRHTHREWSG